MLAWRQVARTIYSSSATGSDPHPLVQPIAFLLGTWRGEGRGEYPTVDAFEYREEVRFWHEGKPFVLYAQRTWRLPDESVSHGEMGYWRPHQDGGIELVLAHTTGVVELAEGRVEGTTIEVASSALTATSSAKEVTELRRRLEVDGDRLSYELTMAAV